MTKTKRENDNFVDVVDAKNEGIKSAEKNHVRE